MNIRSCLDEKSRAHPVLPKAGGCKRRGTIRRDSIHIGTSSYQQLDTARVTGALNARQMKRREPTTVFHVDIGPEADEKLQLLMLPAATGHPERPGEVVLALHCLHALAQI